MTLCGICVSAKATCKCSQCGVQTCKKCNKYEAFAEDILNVCVLCHVWVKEFDLFCGNYCMHCDTYIPYNKGGYDYYDPCLNCVNKKTTIENRLLLPHYKAMHIIETQYIPDIAKIIFDYYYVSRRYYEGEF